MKISDIEQMIKMKEKQAKDLQKCREMRKSNFISDKQRLAIDVEIKRLEAELGLQTVNFNYTIEDIANAPDDDMLIPNILPLGSILVIVASYGQGKSTLIRQLLLSLLQSNSNVYVHYVEADNPKQRLKKFGLHESLANYGERFQIFGNNSDCLDMHLSYIDMLLETTKLQKEHKERNYIIVVDNLKNIAKKNKFGLIDTNELFVYEKRFRFVGGTIIISHHTNKKGVSADTKDILNFCDASFKLHYNDVSNAIILEPDKQSRFHLEPKAFLVDSKTKTIVAEVDYNSTMLPDSERQIINHVVEVLTYVDQINQDHLIKETMKYRNKLAMGEKRFRAILHKYSDIYWTTIRSKKNSLIFSSLDKKLPNCQTILGDNHEK